MNIQHSKMTVCILLLLFTCVLTGPAVSGNMTREETQEYVKDLTEMSVEELKEQVNLLKQEKFGHSKSLYLIYGIRKRELNTLVPDLKEAAVSLSEGRGLPNTIIYHILHTLWTFDVQKTDYLKMAKKYKKHPSLSYYSVLILTRYSDKNVQKKLKTLQKEADDHIVNKAMNSVQNIYHMREKLMKRKTLKKKISFLIDGVETLWLNKGAVAPDEIPVIDRFLNSPLKSQDEITIWKARKFRQLSNKHPQKVAEYIARYEGSGRFDYNEKQVRTLHRFILTHVSEETKKAYWKIKKETREKYVKTFSNLSVQELRKRIEQVEQKKMERPKSVYLMYVIRQRGLKELRPKLKQLADTLTEDSKTFPYPLIHHIFHTLWSLGESKSYFLNNVKKYKESINPLIGAGENANNAVYSILMLSRYSDENVVNTLRSLKKKNLGQQYLDPALEIALETERLTERYKKIESREEKISYLLKGPERIWRRMGKVGREEVPDLTTLFDEPLNGPGEELDYWKARTLRGLSKKHPQKVAEQIEGYEGTGETKLDEKQRRALHHYILKYVSEEAREAYDKRKKK